MLTILLFLLFYCNYLRIQLHRPKKEYSLSRMKNKSSENPRFVLLEIISSMFKFQRYRTKVKFFYIPLPVIN